MARVVLLILTVFVFGGCCCHGNVILRTESPESGPPVVSSDPPEVDSDPPAVDSDPPVDRDPRVDREPRVVDPDPPVVHPGPPVVGSDPPVSDSNPPVVDTDPPVVDSDVPEEPGKMPKKGSKPPVVDPGPPVVSSDPPEGDSDPPVEEPGKKPKKDSPARFKIPPGHLPDEDQCRIWIPGVPPGQQSPAGDCHELASEVPLGGWLIRGVPKKAKEFDVVVYHDERPGVIVEIRVYSKKDGSFLGRR